MRFALAIGFTITAVSLLVTGTFNGLSAVGALVMAIAAAVLIRREGRA